MKRSEIDTYFVEKEAQRKASESTGIEIKTSTPDLAKATDELVANLWKKETAEHEMTEQDESLRAHVGTILVAKLKVADIKLSLSM